jgi:ABC-type dipeptide/oligopeptide/nickel transport system ATPase component
MKKKALLKINKLAVDFQRPDNLIRAVDHIDLEVNNSEIVGLVGESGSGKTVTSLAVLNLIAKPGTIKNGSINWQGSDILKMGDNELRKVRGGEIAMIFQDPFGSFNPVYTIGSQIAEVIALHQGLNKKEAREAAIEMLKLVKIPEPHKRIDDYPHQFSGGMCQRAMIAMALSCKPKLLIADEPTTALDVTIQKQILELLLEVKEKFKMSILLITHDLGVIAQVCDRVYVMENGKIVENGAVAKIFKAPGKKYTKNLLQAILMPDPAKKSF